MTTEKIVQSIDHGGTGNNTFTDKALTYYNDDAEKIVSVPGTEVTQDEEENPVLHVDRADVDYLNVNHDAVVNGETTLKDDVTAEKDLSVFGDLTVTGESEFSSDVVISGNLTVRGTSTEEHTQDIFVGSDTLTLRDGASTALTSGEVAGVIINKYDGTDSLGLVTTSDGTLRVGELNLVYCFTTSDSTAPEYGHYYSDKELTTEINIPSGKTFIAESTDPTTHLVKGYYKDKDETEPLMTRDEAVNLSDGKLLIWDATDKEAKTSAVDPGELIQDLQDLKEHEVLGHDDKIVLSGIMSGAARTGTRISLADNNKFYHEPATLSGIPTGAYITYANTIDSGCIAISDTISEGDHNVPTSDAVFNYLRTHGGLFDVTWSIDETGHLTYTTN